MVETGPARCLRFLLIRGQHANEMQISLWNCARPSHLPTLCPVLPPRLREAATVPGALGAPAGPDQEAAQTEDHLLELAAAASKPAFPAYAIPGAAREGPAGSAARPHPDPGGASPSLPAR